MKSSMTYNSISLSQFYVTYWLANGNKKKKLGCCRQSVVPEPETLWSITDLWDPEKEDMITLINPQRRKNCHMMTLILPCSLRKYMLEKRKCFTEGNWVYEQGDEYQKCFWIANIRNSVIIFQFVWILETRNSSYLLVPWREWNITWQSTWFYKWQLYICGIKSSWFPGVLC